MCMTPKAMLQALAMEKAELVAFRRVMDTAADPGTHVDDYNRLARDCLDREQEKMREGPARWTFRNAFYPQGFLVGMGTHPQLIYEYLHLPIGLFVII